MSLSPSRTEPDDTPTVIVTDAVLAAEQYKRASELLERAKADLIAAVRRDSTLLNKRGVAHLAGIEESTLYKWIKRSER